MAPPRKPVEDRFWAKVRKNDGCWEWTGGTVRSGLPYGRLSLPGRGGGQVFAHRFSYELHNGPIPAGLMVLHRCDNARCVRPDHLFLGTHADNMADRNAKGRTGRQQGENHYAAKLTSADILKIRADRRLHREIAAEFNVHKALVSQVKRRIVWRHV